MNYDYYLREPRLEDAAQLVGHDDDVVARRVVRVAILEHEPHVGGKLALRSVHHRSKVKTVIVVVWGKDLT